VLYAPKPGITLLSANKTTAAGYSVSFRATDCRIYDSKDKVLAKIPIREGLYRTETDTPSANTAQEPLITVTLDDLHQMLGHISPDAAKRLVKEYIVEGIILDESATTPRSCDSCEYGKKTHKAVKKFRERARAKKVGELIHSDLWGPSPTRTPQHKEYYVSYMDDHFRYSVVYLIRTKDETFETYEQ
jgi:DNA-binding Lrp family transcriptional regulator